MRAVFAPRHELWISMPLVVVATLLFYGHVPRVFEDEIGESAAVTFGRVMAFNAVRDWHRTGPPGKATAVVWFPLVSWFAALVLYEAFTTRVVSNR